MADEETNEQMELVHPHNEGFVEKVTPKPLSPNVHLFTCDCESVHFRHAGYISTMVPFMRSGGEKKVAMTAEQVKVCVACKKCYAWINEQMYDITDRINLKAWKKAEKKLHKATGPGGQC